MKNLNFKIGQVVNYTNGNLSIYTAEIVKIKEKTLIVIDDYSAMQLYKSSCNIGTEITFNQIKFD
jgi:hypothetical protein